MNIPSRLPDLCIKCNICVAACPVMPATDLFPGPKATGPQADRFVHPDLPVPEYGVGWCSGCGVCSRVCPHGVPVTELNIRAKARCASGSRTPLRDQLISRPHLLAHLAGPVRPIANWALRSRPVRWMLEKVFRISRNAPLPKFAVRSFRKQVTEYLRPSPPPDLPQTRESRVAYFHGCSVEGYEPSLGLMTVALLEELGFHVDIPPQTCCGLSLQSNGLFDAARTQARENIEDLLPYAGAGVPIVGTSTSCTLALRHDYSEILGLQDEAALHVAEKIRDLFEFLVYDHPDRTATLDLSPVPLRALYHPPCQLKAHGMGIPAYQVLRRIPQLELHLSESECCGIAGTYGIKLERYSVARAVGSRLLDQISQLGPDIIITDSETCRWWISHHSQTPAFHPLEVLHLSLSLGNGIAGPVSDGLGRLVRAAPEKRRTT